MRVAVIGTGIAGNAAAWTLSKHYPVTVYDREIRPGGHSHTVTIDYDGTPLAVDIGFIVYNELNYPELTALFAHLDIETVESCMSFAVTTDGGRFEWKGGGSSWRETAKGLFAQPRNLLSPSYLRMLRDILTFNAQSVTDHAAGRLAGLTLAEYFRKRKFAPRLLTDYLAPMGGAIWSAPACGIQFFPAENFVAFFNNHRLLQYDRPVWRTVKGGSARYVEKLTSAFRDRLRLGCAVRRIGRTPHGVVVHDRHGRSETYDYVVIGAHSDHALAMLSDADTSERAILGAIGYSPNAVFLHRDIRLMPRRKSAWASWNFLRWQREDTVENDVAVTYWMNNLQVSTPTGRFSSASSRRSSRQANSPSANTSANTRNIMQPPLPRRSALAGFRDGGIPGSAAPGPDMVFMRTDCGRGSRSPNRSALSRPGASRRPNSQRLRSSGARPTRQRRPTRQSRD